MVHAGVNNVWFGLANPSCKAHHQQRVWQSRSHAERPHTYTGLLHWLRQVQYGGKRNNLIFKSWVIPTRNDSAEHSFGAGWAEGRDDVRELCHVAPPGPPNRLVAKQWIVYLS